MSDEQMRLEIVREVREASARALEEFRARALEEFRDELRGVRDDLQRVTRAVDILQDSDEAQRRGELVKVAEACIEIHQLLAPIRARSARR